jgi:redox-sensitive bicupin YhaK (pirin superfamily)
MRTSSIAPPGVSIRRAADRHQTQIGWLHGRHSFDTGIDPLGADTHHGVLVVSNHDTIAPRSGFDTHPHRNMEIVTWVLDGSLVHQDSEGHTGLIYPNLAQRMTAGTGIRHSEKNDRPAVNPDGERPLDLIQMWVVPDAPFAHVYLARGRMDLEAEGALDAGDAARLTAAGERRLTAAEPSEVLIWEMHASLSPVAG